MAYDRNSQTAHPADLARSPPIVYRMALGRDLLSDSETFRDPADAVVHHWTPHPSGQRQPHEVPWSLSGIENLQVIPAPYSIWIYGGSILILLISLMFVIHKIRRKSRSVVEMDSEREVEAG
jgi:hypothetical protein